MSTLKAKIANATTSRSPTPSPRSSVDLGTNKEANKYRLLITAGPSYDTSTHQIVHVNTDTPTSISNAFLNAKIKVRIRGFRGLPSSSPSTSPYFEDSVHEKDQYSVAFSFVPKQDLPSLDLVWGNDFDHPVRDRLPPGFNTAFRIVKDFIDPGLECDAYADEPWLYGPALSCWFGFRIGEKSRDGRELPNNVDEADDILREGADGSGAAVREKHYIPENNEKRRKYFLSAGHREQFVFEKGRKYSGDFYNPYLDFGNFALKLPGFSIKVIKYIDEKSHTLRYVFKNRKTGDVYFCVNFNLLWGEQLQRALQDDQDQLQAFAGAERNGEMDGATNAEDVNSSDSDKQSARAKEQELPGAKDGESSHPEEAGPNQARTEEPNHVEDSRAQQDDPGLRDKPDALREKIQNLSIEEMLLATSSKDMRGSNRRILEDLD